MAEAGPADELTPARARALDKFYTKEGCVRRLLGGLAVHPAAGRLAARAEAVLEPSAGAGAFVRVARQVLPGLDPVAFDLHPERAGIVRQDFLAPGAPAVVAAALRGRPAIVVGNPPYGRSCSLALAFLNRCAALPGVSLVAFVLPRAFQKASTQKKVARRLALLHEEEVPADSFTLCGVDKAVPSCWQVWRVLPEGEERPRPPPPPAPVGYRFLAAAACAQHGAPFDVEVYRVGIAAGTGRLPAAARRCKYNYFLELAPRFRPHAAALVAGLAPAAAPGGALHRLASRATGPHSLSKPELIPVINRVLQNAAAAAGPDGDSDSG